MNTRELRQSARLIWEAALNAANPATCIPKFLQLKDNVLTAGGKAIEIGGRLIVTKYGHALPLRRMKLVEAAHPIPDSAGIRAVHDTRELLRGLAKDDIVLVLISGGGSALWPAPAEGITLEEKQEVTQLLLRAGATIRELNAIRKHLSVMKGGQLARWASPAHVISLIMSDVIGDPI